MALLMLITLGAFSHAGIGKYPLGQRGTKVQLVQLCQLAHTNTAHFLVGDEFDAILSELNNEERRRHPALPERFACAYCIGV